ncbi:hypothetical protein EYC80_000572 [Monilinia laxa]|uniref:Uncharacterized protein n=1 Tax=Monilinia laxa TaxID=61186 RepID=A0A5N6KB40_MONLA|nr:hypothetical protein EYC80_000572 [Monilinia laxa]
MFLHLWDSNIQKNYTKQPDLCNGTSNLIIKFVSFIYFIFGHATRNYKSHCIISQSISILTSMNNQYQPPTQT